MIAPPPPITHTHMSTDPNVRTKDGLTPLHFAARHLPRSSDTVTEAKGASDAKSTSRQVIQLLLRADGESVGGQAIVHGAKDNQGVTPLHMACSRGNVPAVQELLKYIKGIVHFVVILSEAMHSGCHVACADPTLILFLYYPLKWKVGNIEHQTSHYVVVLN